jgi:hypothetical protein
MGYAGNYEPNFIVPTLIATKNEEKAPKVKDEILDLDFYIGEEAQVSTRDSFSSYCCCLFAPCMCMCLFSLFVSTHLLFVIPRSIRPSVLSTM